MSRPNGSSASRLNGARVLITGASSGVGARAAEVFSCAGAHVVLLARRADKLHELAERLPHPAHAVATDVADAAAVNRAFEVADEQLGGLDIAVNAAGVGFPTALEDIDPETWRRVIDINLSGSFFVARQAGLRMRAGGGGVIVNVGSELSSIGMGLFVHYCASKFGVIGMTKALAAELAPDVRVNVVCPGPIDTPMMDAELEWFADPAKARQEAIERVPLKRFASTDEVVAAIRYLAVEATYATGATLELDGGTTVV